MVAWPPELVAVGDEVKPRTGLDLAAVQAHLQSHRMSHSAGSRVGSRVKSGP